ncbi:family 10 glycosylhydrolase [Tolypothrix sp. FACHB-123]|uniref:family 10 glycosylhydrolase n=1 Tax=Tolypothrix sp. FACHB-123 TaxID=2692868 RepID=UPI00168274DE|nr:family 10 glycosylhydrolase [Tolypothrix sp. FACHB-123]MBD2355775.1 family 10 glycosylhydrolase [Tolypothrix sp. FACHB-123]
MKNQENRITNIQLIIKKAGFFIFNLQFLLINSLGILPATAADEEPVLSIVYSQDNSNQWSTIASRLQAAGVKYCVIALDNVRSPADWGDRRVLFLPNVETLTPAQAIALEEWMSKGGRLIASGPVGSLSASGVRQLLRTLLGGYWGFSLSQTQQLQPTKTKLPEEWLNQERLYGKVHGGVLVGESLSAPAAVWNAQDSPAAVVTTDRSTLLGWRWGVDTVTSAELDRAWLQASIQRYMKLPPSASRKVEGGSPSCANSVEVALKKSNPQTPASPTALQPTTPKPPTSPTALQPTTPKSPTPTPQNSPAKNPQPAAIATAPQPRPLGNMTPQRSREAIDELEEAVRLDVVPNSNAPIGRVEAIALQQELENLIGRVQSAHIAATVSASGEGENTASSTPGLKVDRTGFVASRSGIAIPDSEQAIAQAREIAKNIPQLIAQGNYALARQQWLKAKAMLWKQFPLDRRLAQPEIRSVWLDRGTIVRAGSEQGLAQIFDRLSQAGINTVFFETVNASYPIYPSQVAPQQNPLIRGWDPLASAVKLAHARGMELHAWVWVFAAGNQRHNEVLNQPSNYLGPVLAANPDWANYDNRGNIIPVGQTKPFFDPANPQLRQYLLKLYEEIVTRYQVDGIQLDYIRYPFQDPAAGRMYGYGKAAREQFQQRTGVDPLKVSPSDRDLWQKWTAFRTEQVNTFVAQLSQQLRQKRPNLILSVAVFPLPEIERVQKIQQHWEVWARQGDIDLVVPMTYALDTPRFQRLAQPWITSTKLGATLLVPGIRLLSLPTVGAFDQLQLVRDLPVSGYALFAAENLNNELQQLFSNTQGKLQPITKEPIPHRQPFQTAVVRYATLQREWKLILQNEQLSMSATEIAQFNNQAQALQTALSQLAAAPSASKFIAAKASLTRFQSQLRIWMRQEAINNPYQVKVWENRLATIERLLRYGERHMLSRP